MLATSGVNPALAESTPPTITAVSEAAPLTTQRKTQRIADTLVGKIGVLKSQDGVARCTAFCLSNTLIATAAHCLRARPDDRRVHHAGMRFTPSIAPNAPATAITTQFEAGPSSKISGLVSGGAHISFRKPIEAQQDWAILRLRKPVCTRGGVTLASKSPRDGHTSHQGDLFAPRVAIQRDGHTTFTAHACKHQKLSQKKNFVAFKTDFSDANRLMFHNCDAGPLASGAPLLESTPFGLEVTAMHVGTYVRSRFVETDRAIVQRIASRPVANIAIPVAEFVRPIQDLLKPRAQLNLPEQN